MKFGKVEITEFVALFIILIGLVMAVTIISGKIDIEKEKTKQLEIQLQAEQKKLEIERRQNGNE